MQEVFSTPTVSIYIDKDQSIIEVKWNGLITDHDLSEALDVVKENLFKKTNMIVNRTDLLDFDSKARKWIIYVLMRQEAKKLVPHFNRLATIEPQTKVTMFTRAVNQLGRFIFPNLLMESFGHVDDAIRWIKEDTIAREEQDKKEQRTSKESGSSSKFLKAITSFFSR